ncbi:MAG: phosphatidate cytidylyltransferase [Caulobacteraceae bacterium]
MEEPKSVMSSLPAKKRFDWSNLRLRVLSAAVMAPAAILAVWAGGYPLLGVLLVVICLLVREWALMSTPQAPIRAGVTMAVAIFISAFVAEAHHIIIALLLLCVSAAVVAGAAALRRVGARPADEALGVIYLGGPCVAMIWLRTGDLGLAWTLALLATAWSADIAAYVAGNSIGGPKLWPRISPNKTWSGFIAGLIAAVFAAELVAFFTSAWPGPPLRWAWAIGLIVGLATMAGDICESMLKRRFGVKDSGDLIPGHGGLLDRVDGLMFAILAMAALRALAHFGAP